MFMETAKMPSLRAARLHALSGNTVVEGLHRKESSGSPGSGQNSGDIPEWMQHRDACARGEGREDRTLWEGRILFGRSAGHWSGDRGSRDWLRERAGTERTEFAIQPATQLVQFAT